jgi:hypothetical protein
MAMLRLLTIALCAANLVMLATWRPAQVEPRESTLSECGPMGRPLPVARRYDGRGHTQMANAQDWAASQVRVIDVAHGVAQSLSTLETLAMLRPGEQLAAIDNIDLSENDPGAVIESLAPRSGEYLDLTVSNGSRERRVLVLWH